MAFIDNLAYSLMAISFAGFMLLYTVFSIYRSYVRKKNDFSGYLYGASIPLLLIGLYMVVTGIWGQFVWPLPGSYNILFYDPLVSFGIVLLSFSISVRLKARLDYSGFLGLMVGIMVIAYGIVGYNLGLTSEPSALLAMYFLYGLAGILSYPMSLLMVEGSWLTGSRRSIWKGWYAIIALFCIMILFASLLSAFVGISAITMHLVKAP